MRRLLWLSALVLTLLAARATAIPDVLSPGELARPHSALSGSLRCTECHPAGQRHSAQACLTCHEELEPALAADAGYHGGLGPDTRSACHRCHREHRGQGAPLIDWGREGPAGFDHALTGFELEGAHAALKCGDCHRVEFLAPDSGVRAMLAEQPLRVSYLGLPTSCASCHFDEHRGQEKDPCDKCHDASRWKDAPRFDHDDERHARYPLEGRHRYVPCALCHPAQLDRTTPGRAAFPSPRKARYLTFLPLKFERCLDCHEDQHQGRLGEACEDCHAHSGWSPLQLETRAFHDKLRFKLEGAHLAVECRACHGPGPGLAQKTLRGLAFQRCADCHADAHLGQLAPADGGVGPDCAQCHVAKAFAPARYEEAAHRDAGFFLEDSHRAVACSACHPQAPQLAARVSPAVKATLARQGRPARFSFARFDLPEAVKEPQRCEGCHDDVHDEQFKDRKDGCRGCHRRASFADLSFDHDAGSRFPLEGKHLEVACSACHPAEPANKGRSPVVRYRPLPMECEACHGDQHAGQFAPPPGKQRPECKRCHTPRAFQPSAFTHEEPFTAFKLKGKHRDLKCEQCHPEVQLGPLLKTARYKPLPGDCEGCHRDQHEGEFGGYAP